MKKPNLWDKMPESIKTPITKAYGVVYENLPAIMIFGGAAALLVDIVVTAKETYHVDERIFEEVEAVDDAVASTSFVNEETGELISVPFADYIKTVVPPVGKLTGKLLLIYWKSLLLAALGTASIAFGYKDIHNRYIGLSITCASLSEAYKKYREAIVDKYGKEVDDEIALGLTDKELESPVLDKNGNPKTDKNGVPKVTKETLHIIDPEHTGEYSPFAFVLSNYNPDNTKNNIWESTMFYNIDYAKKMELFFDQQIHGNLKGFITYNEILDTFDLPASPYMTAGAHREMFDADHHFKLNYREVMTEDNEPALLFEPDVIPDIHTFFIKKNYYTRLH